MRYIIPMMFLASSAFAGELNFQGFGDTDHDGNINITYRHSVSPVFHVGIIDGGLGGGLVYKNKDFTLSAEAGYDFYHGGIVGNMDISRVAHLSREYVANDVWMSGAIISHDIEITDKLTIIPSIRGGWYSDGNAMKGVKLSGIYSINDDWIIRGESMWRGWNEQEKEYYSPNHETRSSIVPMYRWSGMQVGVGPLYINEGENSMGARVEFRMRNPQVRVVIDATQVYSSAYVYLNWSF